MAVLVPSLVALRTQVNALAPNRDKTSDGWIGDPAHQATNSQHNPDGRGLVHAIDVDVDLREPGLTMEAIVQHLLRRARAGEHRITEMIYDGRIWTAARDWTQRAYTGSNPHGKHAHFTGSNLPSLENSVGTYRLEEIPVALTSADKQWLLDNIRSITSEEVEKRVGDVVTRYDAAGAAITGTNNDTMGVSSAAGYTSRDAGMVRREVHDVVLPALARIEDAISPTVPPAGVHAVER